MTNPMEPAEEPWPVWPATRTIPVPLSVSRGPTRIVSAPSSLPPESRKHPERQ